MRAPNERYSKLSKPGSGIVFSKPGKDVFGYEIKKGAYVIWHPYSPSNRGMHIGEVLDVNADLIKIKTADNKIIYRGGYELVLFLQNRMAFENNFNIE